MNFSKNTATPARRFQPGTKLRKILGFTLVELIVVITVLAILGTIGFLSI